jgi:hypothetical protein
MLSLHPALPRPSVSSVRRPAARRCSALAAIAGALLLGAAACSDERQEPADVSARELEQKVQEAVDAAAKLAARGLSQFRQEADRTLQELERSVDAASARARELSGDARAEAQDQLGRAKERAGELHERLEAIRKDASANWNDAAEEIERALTELEEEVARTVDEIGGSASRNE